MSSKSEYAINNTSIWLDESPIPHQRLNHNSFLITDSTNGVPRYEIELSIGESNVGYASKIINSLQGPTRGMLKVDEACLKYNHDYTGPSLCKGPDGSIVARNDYLVEEHTPHKMFSTLASFEPIHREVGPQIIEIAALNNLRFKDK
jgi:hypothetical protein